MKRQGNELESRMSWLGESMQYSFWDDCKGSQRKDTYQCARCIHSRITGVNAVEPFRLAELEKTLLRHCVDGDGYPARSREALPISKCRNSIDSRSRRPLYRISTDVEVDGSGLWVKAGRWLDWAVAQDGPV